MQSKASRECKNIKKWSMTLLEQWKEFRNVEKCIGKIKIFSEEQKRQMVKINYKMGMIFQPIISTLGPIWFERWGYFR